MFFLVNFLSGSDGGKCLFLIFQKKRKKNLETKQKGVTLMLTGLQVYISEFMCHVHGLKVVDLKLSPEA